MRQTLSQIKRVISLIRVAAPDTPLMQYPCNNTAISNLISTLAAPLNTMSEIASPISILPNFSSNHKLRDELDSRQRGIVTTGNGYQPPKPDKVMANTELTAVKKATAKKLARGSKTDVGTMNSGRGGKRLIFKVTSECKSDTVVKEAKTDTAPTGRTVTVKKPSLTQLTDDIEQQAFCSYHLSSKGCNKGDECTHSHNMPADP